MVKPSESESAYLSDVLLLNRPNLANQPLWKKESTLRLTHYTNLLSCASTKIGRFRLGHQ
ncbi:hypothetical protein CDG76_26145 [Nostoc sp. 'Peltigera membranacea cyanobiont' 210A]|nr:hypothetical protein CDG76_26145 [Nostoc sp. 'Peltigera membranacea cyanobiont' 210A]